MKKPWSVPGFPTKQYLPRKGDEILNTCQDWAPEIVK